MQRVCVLYEDQRGPGQGFGLHELAKACVSDAFPATEHPHIKEALGDCRPQKGDGNLLKACREDLDGIANDGRPVVAVFDNDKIRRLLQLSAKAPDARVEQEIRKGGPKSDRLFIILLKQNMESVLKAAHECDPSIDPERIKLATQKKDRLERDAILNRLTGEQYRAVRDCILGKLPSFRAFVDLLRHQFQSPARTRKKKR
ncbi:MAG TPA: hypothetical protein VE153_31960 [Myxococcus sp.]|jgi:hypothetical protein|nr:hypothetical protein [Myxococcus sp.]